MRLCHGEIAWNGVHHMLAAMSGTACERCVWSGTCMQMTPSTGAIGCKSTATTLAGGSGPFLNGSTSLRLST